MNIQRLICLGTILSVLLSSIAGYGKAEADAQDHSKPNIVFILTDDQRWDSVSAIGNNKIATPNLDRIAATGTRFANAFVTLAICSPSRAACLTGRYGSANGVTAVGKQRLNEVEVTFAHALRAAGYATGVTGKWHLQTSPEECGFDFVSTCWSNGTWYDRTFTVDGKKQVMRGFVDDVVADESIRFIQQSLKQDKSFVLWMNTQVPHMDHKHTWPAQQTFLDRRSVNEMPLPATWNEDLSGKPEYLKTSRSRTQAAKYGYDDPDNIRSHSRDYYASVEQMDAAVGRVLDELDRRKRRDNTWIIFMGDNGWFLGEHGFTSKVLPYEESMRVPLAISGPETKPQVSRDLVLNIDLTATIYELAGIDKPTNMHGRSLLSIVSRETPKDWRTSFLYEAPTSQLGSKPLWAVRNGRWKYVETQVAKEPVEVFKELYDLQNDAIEKTNLADQPEHSELLSELAGELREHLRAIGVDKREPMALATGRRGTVFEQPKPAASAVGSQTVQTDLTRTDIKISGVYPHLTTYGVYSRNGAHYKQGHNECGIGAIVPWAGKLWIVNYAPHMPKGSEHKLYSVDPDLSQTMTIHPESVGGTPAGRMIHAESNQLLIAHYLIDSKGIVRVISPKDMPIRVTAIARHLTDPTNMVYYIDMEGSIWEANVHTLAVKRLFKKPVPGWHGKGGYTSQGRLVISNNGELHVGNYNDVFVGGKAKTKEERGVLAEYDGKEWKIVERRQFTEVTGPQGITGGSDGDDPLWSIGWDRRSLRLKLLDDGKWQTFLLPKAAFCNDASHGWYTEWPRIREITDGRWMMDMHGMFFDFPKTFSATNTSGIRPIASHLRYVPDFCAWNDQLVLASDETSIQGNPLAGQPQSNLWFGSYDDLQSWGPASAYGGPWVGDQVKANVPSHPFLIAGFDRRLLHLAIGLAVNDELPQHGFRASDQQPIKSIPQKLASLPRVTVKRGNWRKPAPGFSFTIDAPATIYLAVDRRGEPRPNVDWIKTDMTLTWGANHKDDVYKKTFDAGVVEIPPNVTEHTKGSFGMPHTAFVASDSSSLSIEPSSPASVSTPTPPPKPRNSDVEGPIEFRLEVDKQGNGEWSLLDTIRMSGDYATYEMQAATQAEWIRIVSSRDCVASAYFHLTDSSFPDRSPDAAMFAGLADVDTKDLSSVLLYPAKKNRNLQLVTRNREYLQFTKSGFEFTADETDEKLAKLLEVDHEFTVDDVSVILDVSGKRLRLPKGNAAFDEPFASGWPRGSREVESERHLANIHGTFYEVPLITNGAPPAWHQMRPVSSHSKQIMDFCSWNGLLVLSGVRSDAKPSEHVFMDEQRQAGLWFGGVDDLWKLGKPIGQGGPWHDTPVVAGKPSDAYLMTGYDRKTLKLSADADVRVTVEIDFDHQTGWHQYKSFELQADKPLEYEFPASFSAHWIRFIPSKDCQATAWLKYE